MNHACYEKIQLIGLAITTTPGDLKSIEEMSDDGRYLGLEDAGADMAARLDLIRQAIESAALKQDPDEKTLKIFTVPEFYFRGNKGAYLGIPEEVIKTHFSQFSKTFLAKREYENWLFVLGTLVTSDRKVDREAEPTKSLFPMGDHLLNVYNRLHPQKLDFVGAENAEDQKMRRPLRNLLKILDENAEESPAEDSFANSSDSLNDNDFASVLAAALNYCDSKADLIVDNRCLIIEGGRENPRMIQVLKKYKSKEDFILNGIEENYIQSITRYPEIAARSEQKGEDNDSYSIFEYCGIRFGIEICLDHSRGRLREHLKRNPGDYVDVQLVISCGMDIRNPSVIARSGGVVFNCDGEYVLEDAAENGEHCHTIMKKVLSCAQGNKPAVLSEYVKLNEEGKITFPCKGEFYPCQSFQLHIYSPYDLSGSVI